MSKMNINLRVSNSFSWEKKSKKAAFYSGHCIDQALKVGVLYMLSPLTIVQL